MKSSSSSTSVVMMSAVILLSSTVLVAAIPVDRHAAPASLDSRAINNNHLAVRQELLSSVSYASDPQTTSDAAVQATSTADVWSSGPAPTGLQGPFSSIYVPAGAEPTTIIASSVSPSACSAVVELASETPILYSSLSLASTAEVSSSGPVATSTGFASISGSAAYGFASTIEYIPADFTTIIDSTAVAPCPTAAHTSSSDSVAYGFASTLVFETASSAVYTTTAESSIAPCPTGVADQQYSVGYISVDESAAYGFASTLAAAIPAAPTTIIEPSPAVCSAAVSSDSGPVASGYPSVWSSGAAEPAQVTTVEVSSSAAAPSLTPAAAVLATTTFASSPTVSSAAVVAAGVSVANLSTSDGQKGTKMRTQTVALAAFGALSAVLVF